MIITNYNNNEINNINNNKNNKKPLFQTKRTDESLFGHIQYSRSKPK